MHSLDSMLIISHLTTRKRPLIFSLKEIKRMQLMEIPQYFSNILKSSYDT